MNLTEAVKLLKLDKNITLMRRSKDFKITFGSMNVNLSIEEILAEDWYVVKDEKLHTFEEAITAIKNGKTVKKLSKPQILYSTGKYGCNLDVCLFNIDDIRANDWIIEEK